MTDRRLNAYFVEFEAVPREKARRHHHPGAEVVYVIRGRLIVTVGDAEHLLDRGDSMYFDPPTPHAYRREGKAPCSAVVVTTG